MLFLCAALFLTQALFAQGFQIGVKAGANISNFTGGSFDSLGKKALVSYHAGAFIRFKFGNNLALQPEVVFSSQGAQLKYQGSEKDFKIGYVNIPILLQYEMNSGFYLEAGPQFGFKVDENLPYETTENFAKSSDIAIALGLGYHSHIGLGIDARYNIGVSQVGDFQATNVDPNFKNGVIQIGLFYTLFNNNKKK